MSEYVIDGSGKIVGRVASSIAKLLLNSNDVVLLNAEKMVISGHTTEVLIKYKRKIELRDKANPEHSPYISRRPDLFVKRIVRGMLPYKKPKGKTAYKRLKVYIDIPEKFKSAKIHDIKSKKSTEVFENTITIKELTEKLGYKVV